MSKDGRDSATLILMKISHFDRTALYTQQPSLLGPNILFASPYTKKTRILVESCFLKAIFSVFHYAFPHWGTYLL